MFVAYINLALLFAFCMAIVCFLAEAIKVRKLNTELYRLRRDEALKQYQLQPKRGRGRPRKNTITF
jgi:hypothetical protein